MGKPTLPDPTIARQLGINSKTGLPLKLDSLYGLSNIQKRTQDALTIIDEQQAINRFTWFNLPDGLTGELLERILYYKGQGMFFYMEPNDKFYFLPYALSGNINVYGEYMGVTPLPFGGAAATDHDGKTRPWIEGLLREPQREVLSLEDVDWKTYTNKCVLLHDYAKGLSELVLPRETINRPFIEAEANCVAYMDTALSGATGVAGMRVNSEDEQSNVKAAAAAARRSALTGEKWIPIVGQVDFQALDTSTAAQAQEFMLAMNSLDNLRLSTLGLENGGMFEKQGTILQSEADVSGSNTQLMMNDSLRLRQEFCMIVNSIWGLNIWVVPTLMANPQGTSQEVNIEGQSGPSQSDNSAREDDTHE